MRSQIKFEDRMIFRPFDQLAKTFILFVKLFGICTLSLTLTGCFTSTRIQGYFISDDAVEQVRAGTSQEVVKTVLGTPQTQNSFGEETVFYYVETIIEETAFRAKFIKERTVLAVHFGPDRRVSRKRIYTLQDGRVIDPVTRRTPSYGLDRTFVNQLLNSSLF